VDAFFTFLIDGVFFLVGKGVWWTLRKLRIPIPELGHWSYVVLGFVAVVVLGILAFSIVGSIYVK